MTVVPDLSVIIVNWNSRALLRDCLDSIVSEAAGIDVEIIIVDNGSSDGSTEMVRREYPQVRLQCNERNEGFAKPNNDGMRMSHGRYVLLLNNDTIVQPNSLKTLVRLMDEHPDWGACGPMLLNPDRSLQRSVSGLYDPWTHACDMLLLDKIFPNSRLFGRHDMRYFDYSRTQEAENIMGAAICARRTAIDELGMLDENLVIYYNDHDWCRRFHMSKWKLMYVAEATIVHIGGQATKVLNKNLSFVREMVNNAMLYYEKHFGRSGVLAYRMLLFIGFLMRTIGYGLQALLTRSETASVMMRRSFIQLTIGAAFWRMPRRESKFFTS
jgi:GT2 family glycosyltransferase